MSEHLREKEKGPPNEKWNDLNKLISFNLGQNENEQLYEELHKQSLLNKEWIDKDAADLDSTNRRYLEEEEEDGDEVNSFNHYKYSETFHNPFQLNQFQKPVNLSEGNVKDYLDCQLGDFGLSMPPTHFESEKIFEL